MLKPIFEKKLINGYIFQTFNQKPEIDFFQIGQTHSTIYCDLTNLDSSKIAIADAIISNKFSKALAIRTADCLPMAILGSKGSALIHAGWKGLAHGILQDTILENIDPIYSFIGPAIHQHNYQVSTEFLNHFSNKKNFTEDPLQKGKWKFDLIQEACDQLKSRFPNMFIEDSKICTFDTPYLFSFRRDKTDQRNWNILKMDGTP